jgi:hypothetical protein
MIELAGHDLDIGHLRERDNLIEGELPANKVQGGLFGGDKLTGP